MTLKPVLSQAENDCGVCAVACVLDISWGWARDCMWVDLPPGKRPTKSFACRTKQLVQAIKMHGRHLPARRMKSLKDMQWSSIKDCPLALVKVQCADTRYSHIVVFDGEFVYDNDRADPIPVADYERRPLSYIALWESL